MSDFKFKTYRCEWQIQFHIVDQYGYTLKTYHTIPFPTYEAAVDARPTYAKQHSHVKSRWIPKDATNDYQQVDIIYEEVEVEEYGRSLT